MHKIPEYGTDNHNNLVNLMRGMVKLSDDKMSERTEAWDNAERTNRSYIPAEDAERQRKARNNNIKGFQTIYVPYTYAMQMAAHTYLTSVFLGRANIFQYTGVSGQGEDQTLMAEALIDYQMHSGELLTKQYFWLNDILQYGVGIQGIYWDEEMTFITEYVEQPVTNNGVIVPDEVEEVEQITEIEGYKGHKGFNVRPKDFICDPRVSWAEFQNGEFAGRRVRVAYHEILHGAESKRYYNVEALSKNETSQKFNDLQGDNPALNETSDTPIALGGTRTKDYVNLIELYVRLIPSKYGLGSNTRPEIWVLTLANRNVLIGARPSGWHHNMYPYIVQPMELDAYGLSSRGFPELGLPLEQTYNWLINSHMFNVDKAVNNEFIFDPTMINTKDFLDPRPGKRIRLKPMAYGKDIRSMVHQFTQVDMTASNFQDLKVIEGAYQRLFGISEQMLGGLNQGGRKSATEIRSAAGGGLSRMKVLAEFISAGGFSQLGRQLLLNSRQMYTPEQMMQIAGKAFTDIQGEVQFTGLQGEFAMNPVDGTLPIDRFAQTALYKELLMGVNSLPQIAGRYDIASMFGWIAKLSGIKNMDSFEIKAMDEERLAREIRLGNMLTTGEANANIGSGTGEAGAGDGRVAGAPSVTRMGATG